ncbi:MAG TPA: hypothetical protein PKW95_09375 [bacterium]|nr:hypothetical protein [bacterium]
MNQDAPRFNWKTYLYFAVVLGVYAALIVSIRAQAPSDNTAFLDWASPEDGFCETLNLEFVALNFFLAIYLLKKFWRRKTFVRRILWLLYFFIWFGEESQWGQSIFQFATPWWWEGMSGKNAFDLHTVVNYGCILSVGMTLATGIAFLTGFIRAWRGDKWSRLFCVGPFLVVLSGSFLPDRDYLWQLFISFVLAAYFALEAWQREPQPHLAEPTP